MLINLKVKTLDAQTHEFSIDNEITVREFKDKIAEKTNISADQQRIIYCGRVLADEKQLKEYDVDGKVVHVAERPPPSQRGPSSSSAFPNEGSARERPAGRGMRNSPLFRALDGMVVGTMAIPVNPNMQSSGQMPVNPFTSSSSFCMNRITVARHMLECANNIAAYLEDPERGLNNTSLDILSRGRWTMESTVVEVGITATELPQNQNIVEMVQGAVSAALRRNGNTNVTVVQLPTVFGSDEAEASGEGAASNAGTTNGTSVEAGPSAAVIIEDVIEGDEDVATNASSNVAQAGSATSNSSTSSSSTASGPATNAADAANNSSTTTGTNTEDNVARRRTGTNVLADVIDQMRTVQTRLAPFVEQFYALLRTEPTFEENDTVGRENSQRLYDRVSEAFHYMSHAQHAISDLMLDISQPTPRYLTCRPILVEQTGYLSSNNYAAAAAAAAATAAARQQPPHHMFHRQQQPPQHVYHRQQQQSTASAADNNAAASATAETAENMATVESSASSTASSNTNGTVEDPVDDPVVVPNVPPAIIAAAAANAANANVGTQSNDNHQMQMARFIQAMVNAAPIDTEFHVQINAPIVSFGVPIPIGQGGARNATQQQQQRQQQQANTTAAATATAPIATQTAPSAATAPTDAGSSSAGEAPNNENETGNNSTASPPPAPATTTAAASTAGSTGGESGGGSSADNQARVNTATLPTTSTQTRSTSRPQLQIGNIPTNGWNGRFIPANVMSSFDRFLPCNSHHVREPEGNGNANGNNATAANGASAANANATGGNSAGNANRPLFNMANPANLRNLSRLRPNFRAQPLIVGSTMNPSRPMDYRSFGGPAPLRSSLFGLAASRGAPTGGVLAAPAAATAASAGASNAANTNANTNTAATASLSVSDTYRRNLRTQLNSFLNDSVFEGGPINESTIPPAINRAVRWFGETLDYLPQYEKPEYDSRDSVSNILRCSLPLFIELMNDNGENAAQFEQRLKNICEQFMKRLYSVLCVCVGRTNAEIYWRQLMRSLSVAVVANFHNEALQFLRVYINAGLPAITDTADIQQFIVHRSVAPAAQEKPTPMETDDEQFESPASSSIAGDYVQEYVNSNNELLPESETETEIEPPAEPLPNVVAGTETWHRNFPNDWLPIITRDLQTQAAHRPTQPPFSDAYISGMSAKRRKMIQSTKPPTDVSSLVASSVQKAMHLVGVQSSTMANQPHTADEVTDAIANDVNVQTSFKEALRTNVRERLKKDPDYKSDKYPQATKFSNSNNSK